MAQIIFVIFNSVIVMAINKSGTQNVQADGKPGIAVTGIAPDRPSNDRFGLRSVYMRSRLSAHAPPADGRKQLLNPCNQEIERGDDGGTFVNHTPDRLSQLAGGDASQLRSEHDVLLTVDPKNWSKLLHDDIPCSGNRAQRHDDARRQWLKQVRLDIEQQREAPSSRSVSVLVDGELRHQKLRTLSPNAPCSAISRL